MKKGFNLIQLLIVFAIIGILSTIIFVSGERSRSKARDARRISDIAQIQVALEGYYDQTPVTDRQYPATLSTLVTEKFLPRIPVDPQNNAYVYNRLSNTSYCLGIGLENNSPVIAQGSTTCSVSGLVGSNHYKVAR